LFEAMPEGYPPDLVTLLSQAVAQGASDLHISAGVPPMIRLNGEVTPLYEAPIDGDQTRTLILDILTNAQRARLEDTLELDFAVEVRELGRFRGNAHYSRGALEAAFRYIPEKIPTVEELGHRPSIYPLLALQRGLVLVTGITGSGKSTTMASMVQEIARTRAGVIITVEDPVEYHLTSAKSIIKQREIGQDTLSFAEALRHVLRQDPDVILVGEMRDPETMRAAVTAAETGHLVLATLHTIDAPKAIDRMVDAFPAEQQPQIVAQLANSLEAVISQRLLPRADGKGRVLITETLVANLAVRACIRERRWEQLVGLIEIGTKDGMNTIDESLGELLAQGIVTPEVAAAQARDKELVEELSMRSPAATTKRRGLFG
jgi:twitching motility protein PilT